MTYPIVREDSKILRILSRHLYSGKDDTLRLIADMPLLIIPPLYILEKTNLTKDNFDKREIDTSVNDWNKFYPGFKDIWLQDGLLVDEFAYDDYMSHFVFLHKESEGFKGIPDCYIYGVFQKATANGKKMVMITYYQIIKYRDEPGDHPDNFVVNYWVTVQEYLEKPAKDEVFPGRPVPKRACWGLRIADSGISGAPDLSKAYHNHIKNLLKGRNMTIETYSMDTLSVYTQLLAGFHNFAYHQDKYLTLRHSTKKRSKMVLRKLKKKPWEVRNGSRLIYLNRLPGKCKEHQGGTHTSPVPHKRKGFWKTLNHEVYKNHPLYRVYKGVYVRPAFIGDQDKIVDGHRYTIITKGTRVPGTAND